MTSSRSPWSNTLPSCFYSVLRKIFDSFDNSKKGSISTATVGTIFQAMGIKVTQEALERIIAEVDEDGKRDDRKNSEMELARKTLSPRRLD